MFSFHELRGLITKDHIKAALELIGAAVPVVKAVFSKKAKAEPKPAPQQVSKPEVPAVSPAEIPEPELTAGPPPQEAFVPEPAVQAACAVRVSELKIPTLSEINQYSGAFEAPPFIDSKTRQQVAKAMRDSLPLILLLALLGGMTAAARDGPFAPDAALFLIAALITAKRNTEKKPGDSRNRERRTRHDAHQSQRSRSSAETEPNPARRAGLSSGMTHGAAW